MQSYLHCLRCSNKRSCGTLPDAFRWVQVLRKNSKLTKEERNELTYLQSIVQAYYNNPQELVDELNQLKGDLTGRYTNNEIKKQTREKLFTLIEDLLASSQRELYQIAHNDAFWLSRLHRFEGSNELLNERLAMSDAVGPIASPQVSHPSQQQVVDEPPVDVVGAVNDDGYEWLEWPQSSGAWWYRTAYSNPSGKWESYIGLYVHRLVICKGLDVYSDCKISVF